jgi:hypothetical protein
MIECEDHLSVEALKEVMKDEPVIVILLQAIQRNELAINLKIGEILQLPSPISKFSFFENASNRFFA